MPEGPSSYYIGKMLDVAFRSAAYTPTSSFLQLHTNAPGAAGTANVVTGASGSDRKAVTFGAPSTAAGATTILNSAQVQWTNLTNPQDASHYTLWDAISAGNFLGSGVVNANAFASGDTLTFAVGAISLSFTVAS